MREAVARLHHANDGTRRVVEPLALQLTRHQFFKALENVEQRRKTTAVKNDAGLFVHLLRTRVAAVAEARTQAVEEQAERLEYLKTTDPEGYVRLMVASHPWWREAEASLYLDRNVADPAERERLAGLVARLRVSSNQEA